MTKLSPEYSSLKEENMPDSRVGRAKVKKKRIAAADWGKIGSSYYLWGEG